MSSVQTITEFIRAYSAWAGPLSFLSALFGCLLGTNLLVPAGAILTAIGVLVGADVLSWTTVIWATVGAAVGMSTSYAAGVRLGPRVVQLRVLRRFPGLMDRARALVQRHGFAAILIGYFSGPLRAPVAAFAAISGMDRARFEGANAASAFMWVSCSVGIGAAVGAIIEPGSLWLLIAPFVVPLVTIGISMAISMTSGRGDRSP